MKRWLALGLSLFALDQVTKILVLEHISPDERLPVIPGFFNLVQVHNTGAAFGMMTNNNWFFIILASAALLAIAVCAWRGVFRDPFLRAAVALLAAGVAGNLTDRLWHGFVVDFLDFILPWYGPWPSFNVADSCICVAAFLIVISGFSQPAKTAA